MLLLRCVAVALASRRRRQSIAPAPLDHRTDRSRRWRSGRRLRACNACRAVASLQKAALGAAPQPLIEVSGAARALAMNASPQPLRHAAVTAATGRVARLHQNQLCAVDAF